MLQKFDIRVCACSLPGSVVHIVSSTMNSSGLVDVATRSRACASLTTAGLSFGFVCEVSIEILTLFASFRE